MSSFCVIDDKFVPLYRVMWVARTPHFCGEEDCQCEGQYEVRLEQGESLWANSPEKRDEILRAVESWQKGIDSPDDFSDDGEPM